MGKRDGFVLLFILLLPTKGHVQNLVLNDTVTITTLQNYIDPETSLMKFRLTQGMGYSLSFTALVFYNWQQGNNTNLVSLSHNFKYLSQYTNGRNIKISNFFVHDLGIQYFFDSISRFQPDENILDTRIEMRIGKNLIYTVFSNLTTRIFNSYVYATDQTGQLTKTLSASFLTPLLWTFSTGFGWTLPRLGILNLGLSAVKFTWIRNREVYDQQNILTFYGVPKEKNHIFEYGISLHLRVDKDLLKWVHWNCDLLVFKNYQKPIDLVMKNLIGIRINKFLKTSIQTRLCYEKEISKTIQVENLVSLGFYFDL